MKKEEKIKFKLAIYLPYLQLMTSLDPTKDGIINKNIKNKLIEAWNILKSNNKNIIINQGPKHLEFLLKLVDKYTIFAKPKFPLKNISEEFNEICNKSKEIYSYGIEYGWLQRFMDCSNMDISEDFPFHARIGLGHHAGYGNVEEEFLLRDAFFMLILAEYSYDNMYEYLKYWKDSKIEDEPKSAHKIFGTANQNVATYSRVSILSFYSFVEAFVNSVGYDFALRNKDILSSQEIEVLCGTKKGKYLSLEYKIEKYPSIIREDKKIIFILSDPKQTKEPFKKFIDEIKEIRDSSVHYSPKKEAIWRKPEDWIDKAKSTSRFCMDVSLEFWKACYPKRKEPRYLGNLDYETHYKIAKVRFKLQDQMRNTNSKNTA